MSARRAITMGAQSISRTASTGYAGPTGPTPVVQPSNMAEGILQRLSNLCDTASVLAERTERITIRACGPIPKNASEKPHDIPAGIMNGIQARLNDLNDILEHHQDLLTRLDAII